MPLSATPNPYLPFPRIHPWLLLKLPFLMFTSAAMSADWPAWRGPTADGVCSESNLPLTWSATENVRWKIALPDRGNSSPIIFGRRVFLTQAIASDNRRLLLCFDRATGQELWRAGHTQLQNEPTHDTNPQCAASPVTDGERVIAWFGSAGLTCYDMEGRQQWHHALGAQQHIWGNASSPVIHGDLCFLNFGPGEPSFLIALDKKTGQEKWRVTEPNADSGVKKPTQEKALWVGSWSTPIIVNTGEREELLLTWPKRVVAFTPRTGAELWSCAGLNPLVYTSPLYDPSTRIIVAMGGFGGMALAVRAGGSGDVTETRRLWHHPKTKQRIGSGVLAGKHIYILNDPGVAECFELETGKLVWEERLRGPAAKSDNWSSMVRAGDRLYAVNQGGDAFVLRASPKFEVLATNTLAEATVSSIAPSNGEIFLRTHKHLWCLAEGKRPAGAAR